MRSSSEGIQVATSNRCAARRGAVLRLGMPLLGALLVSAVTPASRAAAVDAAELFADRSVVPRDVDLYLRIEDAAAQRRALAGTSFAASLERVLATGAGLTTWNGLAAASGLSPSELFDTIGRRGVTVAARRAAERWDWVVLCAPDPEHLRPLLRRLNPQRRPGQAGCELSSLPEHRLLLATLGGRLIVGPDAPGMQLLPDLLRRLAGQARGAAAASSLAEEQALDDVVASLGRGDLGLFLRHRAEPGGWSAVSARLDGLSLQVRHCARFPAEFFDGTPMVAMNASPIESMARRFPLAWIEPASGGLAGGAIEWLPGVPLLSPAIQAACGPRRVVTVGAPVRRTGGEVGRPALAIAVEIDGLDESVIDRHLGGVAGLIRRLAAAAGTDGPAAGDRGMDRSVEQGLRPEDRCADLGPAIEHLAAGLPLFELSSLNWTFVDQGASRWLVIATEERHLRQSAEALAAGACRAPAPGGVRVEEDLWVSCGYLDGRALVPCVQQWTASAGRFAPPGSEDALRATLEHGADLCGGIEWGRWRVRRLDARSLCVRLELGLLPAPGHP